MKFPPTTYDQLRQATIMIRNGEIALTISKNNLTALKLMVDEPELVATLNIVELSEKVKISPASITRLTKLLGFRGFQAFQQVFKHRNSNEGCFYSNGINQLLTKSHLSPIELIKEQSSLVQTSINNTIAQLDNDTLLKAAKLLSQKNRVHIFAYRHCATIANMLRYGLALIRPNVQMLVQESHGAAIALGQLKKEDLLVVVGSAPYSNITLKIAALAKKQDCQILAITDNEHSPLADIATVAVNVPSSEHFYTNSLVTTSFVVEGLMSLTAMNLGGTATKHVEKHEQLLTQLIETE